jgi:hypothetical protein
MFTVTLFTIGTFRNQPTCPSADDMGKENVEYTHNGVLWYIYTMDYYLVINKNKIKSFAGEWVKQNTSGSERQISHVFYDM